MNQEEEIGILNTELFLSAVPLIIMNMKLFKLCFSCAVLVFIWMVCMRKLKTNPNDALWSILKAMLLIWFVYLVIDTWIMFYATFSELQNNKISETCGLTWLHVKDIVSLIVLLLLMLHQVAILIFVILKFPTT